MKKRLLFCVIFNVILVSVVVVAYLTGYWSKPFIDDRIDDILNQVYEIVVQDVESNKKFCLKKSVKSGEWEILWGNNTWLANSSAVENFYEKMRPKFLKKRRETQKDSILDIEIFTKAGSKSLFLDSQEAVSLFGDNFAAGKDISAYDFLLTSFFNKRVFARVQADCQVFKIRLQNGEFIFSKHDGEWSLDSPKTDLKISSSLVMHFFRALFALEWNTAELNDEKVVQNSMSITLYSKDLSDKVKFLDAGGDVCLAKNEDVDLLFTIKKDAIANLQNEIDFLLKFKIFPFDSCDDLNVLLIPSGERFTFHNLKNQNKWQFTFSKNGELKVKEIDGDCVTHIFEFLKDAESIAVLQSIPVNEKLFIVTMNEFSDSPRSFNFYEDNGRLFVEPDSQKVKFEMRSCFVPMLFHIVRSIMSTGENSLL